MSFVPFNVSNVFNEFNVLQSREVIDRHDDEGEIQPVQPKRKIRSAS